MDAFAIKKCIAEHNDTQVQLAEYLGLQPSGLSDRINGKTPFRLPEIEAIRERYQLSESELMDVFFHAFKPSSSNAGG